MTGFHGFMNLIIQKRYLFSLHRALICVCLWVFSRLFVGYDTMRGLNSLEMLFWN